MRSVAFEDAETYEPDADWERRALAGSDAFSFEWFTKPPGHASPMHAHENEQVCLALEGELTVYSAADPEPVVLEPYDSVHLAGGERHKVVNETDTPAIGVDVFAPGRSFDFWTDRTDDTTDEGTEPDD